VKDISTVPLNLQPVVHTSDCKIDNWASFWYQHFLKTVIWLLFRYWIRSWNKFRM